MTFHLVSDNNYNIIDSWCLKAFYKEWQIMLGIHLVVTLHGRFTISIEQDN